MYVNIHTTSSFTQTRTHRGLGGHGKQNINTGSTSCEIPQHRKKTCVVFFPTSSVSTRPERCPVCVSWCSCIQKILLVFITSVFSDSKFNLWFWSWGLKLGLFVYFSSVMFLGVFTCSISSICIIDGGTLALGRDRASSSFRFKVIMFLKWSRASWRTEGSFPQRHTHISQIGVWRIFSDVYMLQCVYLHRIEDGLQHRQNITEEKIPSIGQRVQ